MVEEMVVCTADPLENGILRWQAEDASREISMVIFNAFSAKISPQKVYGS